MKSELFNLKNKVIAITGGYGYLGSAITLGLANCNATIVVLGKNVEKFNKAFKELHLKNIHFKEFDITDLISIKSGFEGIIRKFGKIDILINNAFAPAKNEDLSKEWKANIEGTLISTQNCIQEILPHFLDNHSGKIINVTSMYGMVAPTFEVYKGCEQYTNPSYYGAAKAAIIQLTKYYASLYGKDNILVNTVSPGPFPNKTVQENVLFIENLKSKTAVKRIGEPDDLQGVFVFLCSNSSNFITGQNIVVDGGWTIM